MMLKKRPKYGNTKVIYDNIEFDSKKEMQRYVVLRDAEEKGLISGLRRQVRFELIPKVTETKIIHLKTKDKAVERTIQLPITYTCDFQYEKDGETITEDVKISPKVLPKELTLKVKMMRAILGINVRLVYKATEEI